VFDGTKCSPYVEDDAVNPLSAYGLSKAEGEAAVRASLEAHVILRTSWMFSATGDNFVKTMLRAGAEHEELGIVNDQHGRPTATEDVAAAIVVMVVGLLEGKAESFGTFHFANEGATTWHGFAREIFAQADPRGYAPVPRLRSISTSEYPTPARRPPNAVLDTQRITRVHGMVPRRWEDALSESLDALIGPVRTHEHRKAAR
jgi:dTDP-4-dehydrorhamnose reductase